MQIFLSSLTLNRFFYFKSALYSKKTLFFKEKVKVNALKNCTYVIALSTYISTSLQIQRGCLEVGCRIYNGPTE